MKKILEKSKIPGVSYIFNKQGIELPIIDITHPAFAIKMNAEQLKAVVDKFTVESNKLEKTPKFLQRLLFFFFLRRSILGRGLLAAEKGFLSAMNTYLMKIGADNLGASYAGVLDRKRAQSLPALSVRLRLEDIVHLLVEGTLPLLKAKPNIPLHFINIAGGPAIDSLNALILIQKENPHLLRSRRIEMHILDLEEEGPQFGEQAVAALQMEKRPLAGLDLHFHYLKYDWSNTTMLTNFINTLSNEPKIVVASSEGGLFEYGSDESIIANLKALNHSASLFVGSVVRADGPTGLSHAKGQNVLQLLIRLKTLESFRTLVEQAGWKIARVLEQPMHYNVTLISRNL